MELKYCKVLDDNRKLTGIPGVLGLRYEKDVKVKDGLQEVPKGDNQPSRHFFPGNFCLHLRDISTLGQQTKL
jgi:hypothetical protein